MSYIDLVAHLIAKYDKLTEITFGSINFLGITHKTFKETKCLKLSLMRKEQQSFST